jgi:hypothetical protein
MGTVMAPADPTPTQAMRRAGLCFNTRQEIGNPQLGYRVRLTQRQYSQAVVFNSFLRRTEPWPRG